MFVRRLQLPLYSINLFCYAVVMKFFLTLVGLIFVLEGLPYVASPEAMRKWLRQLVNMEPGQLRFMGLVAMTVGFILLWLVR